ncbi:hypothetical protein [Desulfonauticus submarinus]|uniref:hypothetical protein n=1 Tax=Desulfonauticus submarinus TaxID=206665 RepID=UPI000B81A680|nr:hypothetical protein [Desulfonauticus submarinus]
MGIQKKINFLEVVDKQNRVIAHLPENEIHKQGLLHRLIAVLAFSKDKKIILKKRKNKNKPYFGHYDLINIHFYPTYSSIELAQNIIYSSLKPHPNRIDFLYIIKSNYTLCNEFIYLYKCTINQESNILQTKDLLCIFPHEITVLKSKILFTPLCISILEKIYL